MHADIAMELAQLGGTGSARDLVYRFGAHRVRAAVLAGCVVRLGHGRYCLPGLEESRQRAHALAAVVSGRSAAALHGLAMLRPPGAPELTVPRHRKLAVARRKGVVVYWADLRPQDVVDGVTEPIRTVVDCAVKLPFDEALAIADSALRAGLVTRRDLTDALPTANFRGSAQLRQVLTEATAEAANPVESALRAIVLTEGVGNFVPQLEVELDGRTVYPDLADADLMIALEVEGFAYHGNRQAWRQDLRRFTALGRVGWLTLRFSWEELMYDQAWVRETVRLAVQVRQTAQLSRASR